MALVGRKQKEVRTSQTFILLVLALIVGGGLAFGALRILGNPVGAGPGHPPKEVMETLDLGEKVLNLADEDPKHYLRIRVVLEYPRNKALIKEIESKQPLLTERLLMVFRSKKAEEVLPVANQEKIKTELLRVINASLEKGKVKQIYFTDFLVQ